LSAIERGNIPTEAEIETSGTTGKKEKLSSILLPHRKSSGSQQLEGGE